MEKGAPFGPPKPPSYPLFLLGQSLHQSSNRFFLSATVCPHPKLGNADHFREGVDSTSDERSGPAFYEKRSDAVDSGGVTAVHRFA